MNELLLNRIVRSPSLPALPQVACDVLNVGSDESAAVANARLAEVVSKDPRLTERLLRAVNSAFYSLKTPCDTVEQAIKAIGGRAVKVLAIGLSMIDSLVQTQRVPFDMDEHCRRTLFSASAARLCAQTIEPSQVEACFLAALLMDIGVMLLGDVLGQEYAKIQAEAGDHANLAAVEKERLGLTHADVAGAIARHWKLPDVLQVPISHHHEPAGIGNSSLRSMTEMACLAGQFADVFVGADPAGSIADVRKIMSERYGLDDAAVDTLFGNVAAAAQALSPAFDLKPDENYSFEAAQMRAAQRPRNLTFGGHAGRERRRAARLSRDGFLTIRPCLDGVFAQPVRVKFCDASVSGIGIIYDSPMAPGTQFAVELPGSRGKPIVYTVVRCIPAGESQFHVGAKLIGQANPTDKKRSPASAKPSKAAATQV